MKIHTHTRNLIASVAFVIGTAVACAGAPPLGIGIGASGGLHLGGGSGASAGMNGMAIGGSNGVNTGAAAGFGAAGAHRNAGFVIPNINADTSAFESIGMRQARFAAIAQNAGGVAASAPGMDRANAHATAAVASSGPSAKAIGSADFSARRQMFAEIDEQVRANDEVVRTLKEEGRSLRGDTRARFKAAVKEIAIRRRALEKSAKIAAKASSDDWTAARANVAANEQGYMDAVERLQSLAASASASTKSEEAVGAGAN